MYMLNKIIINATHNNFLDQRRHKYSMIIWNREYATILYYIHIQNMIRHLYDRRHSLRYRAVCLYGDLSTSQEVGRSVGRLWCGDFVYIFMGIWLCIVVNNNCNCLTIEQLLNHYQSKLMVVVVACIYVSVNI